MLNFVKGATKLARHFSPGHDGRHAVSPYGSGDFGGNVTAVTALEGAQVLRWGTQRPENGPGQAFILDIQLRNGMILTLKDLKSISPAITRGLKWGI
jgi:hypothetical protein